MTSEWPVANAAENAVSSHRGLRHRCGDQASCYGPGVENAGGGGGWGGTSCGKCGTGWKCRVLRKKEGLAIFCVESFGKAVRSI